MKILWFVNIPLPEVCKIRGIKEVPFGGWLVNASQDLAEYQLELCIAYPSSSAEMIETVGEKIKYYSFSKNERNQKKSIEKIIKTIDPSIVHIFGTEFSHSLCVSEVTKQLNVFTVVSIQGLVSICEKHMYANLPCRAIKGKTLRNLVFRDNVEGLRKDFIKRGVSEVQTLQNVNNVIGRTTWDKAITNQINKRAIYYHCNETLRESFYEKKWNIESCEKNSIFLSQASYPIKGLHYVIEALPEVLKIHPDAKLYVAGNDITGKGSIKGLLKRNYYGLYIKRLIKKNSLENVVIFTGMLNERQMLERFLKSNVFVCPSSIENSPNSLGEAMLLGVPVVASFVGGIPDMLEHNSEGYIYQTDAPYMLAHYINKVFSEKLHAIDMSKKSVLRAELTHNKDINSKTLIEIYHKILSS